MQRKIAVVPEKCSGCRICNLLCPFSAITFDDVEMITEINAALCQGCGTCVAGCPSGAITGTQFSDQQVMAQLEGLLSLNGHERIAVQTSEPAAV